MKLPENMVGELIDGELYAWPRPAGPHARFSSALGMDIGSPYDRGRGGPGGWWILDEPELHLGDDVLVPDLAGWRRERMPRIPKSHVFEVPPDWVCEVLSSSNARFDRIKKMPIYAQHEVAWAWLIDPLQKTLETFRLENGRWSSFATSTARSPSMPSPSLWRRLTSMKSARPSPTSPHRSRRRSSSSTSPKSTPSSTSSTLT